MAWFRKGGGGEVNTGDVLVQKRGGGGGGEINLRSN